MEFHDEKQAALSGIDGLLGTEVAPSVTAAPRPGSSQAVSGADAPQLVPLLTVGTRIPLSRDSAATRVTVSPSLEMTARAAALWDRGVQESRELAAWHAELAPSWLDRDHPEADPEEAEAEDLLIGIALRRTAGQARARIRDAHRSVTMLPQSHARLAAGEFPADWFREVLRRTGDLSAAEMTLVDATLAVWDLRITAERFTRELRRLVGLVLSRREVPPHLDPEARRRLEVFTTADDGTACMALHGPIPEILSFSRELDANARAAQNAQRHALAEGLPIPLDPEGEVAATGMPLSLAQLRYLLLIHAQLDAQGVDVPVCRFRMGLTVPAMTLLGVSDAPGMLDGRHPIPADMARRIAAGQQDWYRILTDPTSGEILPVPQDRYRPTPQMLEHLRSRMSTCAVPGCTRPASWDTEADHIEEFDPTDPAAGGRTDVENLHLLCWTHHDMKTHGLLDPVRCPRSDSPTGVAGTWWDVRDRLRIFAEDDTDLATAQMGAELEASWAEHTERREKLERQRARERTGRGSPADDPPGDDPPGERPPGEDPPDAGPPPPF